MSCDHKRTHSVATVGENMEGTVVLSVLVVSLLLLFTSAQLLTYDLDDRKGLGRVFDGIGGLSGGGVSVSLLLLFTSCFQSCIEEG